MPRAPIAGHRVTGRVPMPSATSIRIMGRTAACSADRPVTVPAAFLPTASTSMASARASAGSAAPPPMAHAAFRRGGTTNIEQTRPVDLFHACCVAGSNSGHYGKVAIIPKLHLDSSGTFWGADSGLTGTELGGKVFVFSRTNVDDILMLVSMKEALHEG